GATSVRLQPAGSIAAKKQTSAVRQAMLQNSMAERGVHEPGALQNRRAVQNQDARPVSCNDRFGLAASRSANSAPLYGRWLRSEANGWVGRNQGTKSHHRGRQRMPRRNNGRKAAAALGLTPRGGRGSPGRALCTDRTCE